MARTANPFSARGVLLLLAAGTVAFLLLLYAIGDGWDNDNDDWLRTGHARSDGLKGYSALVQLLERRGHNVSLTNSKDETAAEALLIMTPGHNADGDELWEIVSARRYQGPTLIILPKWLAIPAQLQKIKSAKPGWVTLDSASAPEWPTKFAEISDLSAQPAELNGWRGLNLAGRLPVPKSAQTLSGSPLVPLVEAGPDKAMLAGYWDNNGLYPMLEAAAGVDPLGSDDDYDEELWPVVIVAEPDLMNNYGLSDRKRAELAVALVENTLEDYDLSIAFDLYTAGLGKTDNLLTLAIRPPFLAATLCLLFAALVIAWRGMLRFGPPAMEAPVATLGKQQLARNGAALVVRARRIHLLGPPYAAMIAAHVAASLGIRETDPQARDAAISRIMEQRGLGNHFAGAAEALRRARRPTELLRAAAALRKIERTLNT